MIKLFAGAGFFGALLALSACATLNESECQTVNWQQLGDNDGSQGHASTRIAKHSKACEKHGLPVNVAAYNQGWRAGISRYCTPQNGFNVGSRGAAYKGTCPSEFASQFESAYRVSKNLHDAKQHLHRIEEAVAADIDEVAHLAHSKKPEDKEKLKHVSERLSFNKNDIPRLRSNVTLAERNVQDYLRANPHINAF